MKLTFFIINLCKIALWLMAIPVIIHYFGTILGTAIFITFVFGWNIYATAIGNYRRDQDAWLILHRLFTSKFWLPFLAYGNYCAPHWGDDTANRGLIPISGFDEAGMHHDIDMEFAKTLTDPKEQRKAKNAGDWLFIGRAWTSDNSAHGFEVFGASFGFLLRILGRSVL